MRRYDTITWETNHPLNGALCPVTHRRVYIEDGWKVTRPEYRLRTGILEPSVVLSLPVGHTTMRDTRAFFDILKDIKKNRQLETDKFVLVEDYTLHTGTDTEGRLVYIRRMIEEVKPAAVIFITRSTSWKLSIKIGSVIFGATFPVLLVPSYKDALRTAAGILGRPLLGETHENLPQKENDDGFSITLDVVSPSLLHVVFSGCPAEKDLLVISDLYLGLPHNPQLSRSYRTVHDFSGMTMPPMPLALRIFGSAISRQNNYGDRIVIVENSKPVFRSLIRAVCLIGRERRKIDFYKDYKEAVTVMQPDVEIIPVFRENIRTVALELLEKIVWEKPGYEHLEAVTDPQIKPLALMLGSIKQDVDYYLKQRQEELDNLEAVSRSARQLSHDIEQALLHSEEDRRNAERLSEENMALSGEITRSQKEVFKVLADYIDRRAGFPEGSTRKLARFASKISVFFGYGDDDRERLHDATLLIHTGYLAIPEQEENLELHCIFGGEVLANIYTFIMQYASEIARSHHEKWDGSGYPQQSSGENIPAEARLVAAADFLLSVDNDDLETALDAESGKSLDPAMVATIKGVLPDIRMMLAACEIDGL